MKELKTDYEKMSHIYGVLIAMRAFVGNDTSGVLTEAVQYAGELMAKAAIKDYPLPPIPQG